MDHSVLFVDDEPKVLESISRALHREPYAIHTATSAREGLEILGTIAPSVIVTDMRMPETDGIGFLEKATALYPNAIYIVLSAYSDIERIMLAVNVHHVWRYVSKPWQNEELKLTVKNALEMFEYREEKKQLLESLSKKNKQLEELTELLEDKVRQRTQQLHDKNAILQMLVDNAPAEAIMKTVCQSISSQLGISPIFIHAPFIGRFFSDTESSPSTQLLQMSASASGNRKEIIEKSGIAMPLIRGETVLGTLLIDSPEKLSAFKLIDEAGSFISAATLCLMQVKTLNESLALPDKIDRLLGVL